MEKFASFAKKENIKHLIHCGALTINLNGFIEAIKKIDQIDRRECRKWVEENFTIEKMVNNYEKVFYRILEKTQK